MTSQVATSRAKRVVVTPQVARALHAFADLRLLSSLSMLIDRATLTGEMMLATILNRIPTWALIAGLLALFGYGYVRDQLADEPNCEAYIKAYGLKGDCENAVFRWFK